MLTFLQEPEFLLPFLLALVSLVINIVQMISYRKVKNQISIWSKDARSMAESIAGMKDNIKSKKISSLDDVTTNLETILNFSNSMYTSLSEVVGKNPKSIVKKKKV